MECSGRVREAFRRKGHDAWSCDLLPAEDNSKFHIIGDVYEHLNDGWDLGIFHPTCTFLTLASIRWMYHPEDTWLDAHLRRRHPDYPNRMKDFLSSVSGFQRLQNCSIPKVVIENPQPHGLTTAFVGEYDQKIQPWWFGEGFTKGVCLWLKNVEPLIPTNEVEGREPQCHWMSPGPARQRERSRTYQGIANAFAEKWG